MNEHKKLTKTKTFSLSMQVKELLNICREYLIGLNLETQRKESTDPNRQTELAAYFTHCNLQVKQHFNKKQREKMKTKRNKFI